MTEAQWTNQLEAEDTRRKGWNFEIKSEWPAHLKTPCDAPNCIFFAKTRIGIGPVGSPEYTYLNLCRWDEGMVWKIYDEYCEEEQEWAENLGDG